MGAERGVLCVATSIGAKMRKPALIFGLTLLASPTVDQVSKPNEMTSYGKAGVLTHLSPFQVALMLSVTLIDLAIIPAYIWLTKRHGPTIG